MRPPVPKDTSAIIGEKVTNVSNLGLLFNKYVNAWPPGWEMKEEQKRLFLKNAQIAAQGMASKDKNPVGAYSRRKALCDSMQRAGWLVESFELTTVTRLISGLGGTNVLGTGMTLHPLYGFPYLPGSGIKGLARAYAEIVQVASPLELCEIFGSEDKDPRNAANNRQGRVVFLDGLPLRFPKLEMDIMNPHYGAYYQGEKAGMNGSMPPGDYLNPVPVFFLTVAPGEIFSFGLLSRDENHLKTATGWLIGGLTELGAGGKTNVGYGYFSPLTGAPKTESSGPNAPVLVARSEEQTRPPKAKPEPAEWRDVMLVYSPGSSSISTSRGPEKAFVDHIKDNFVPEHLWPELSKKKKAKASVIVEPIGGNAFKILKIVDE